MWLELSRDPNHGGPGWEVGLRPLPVNIARLATSFAIVAISNGRGRSHRKPLNLRHVLQVFCLRQLSGSVE